MLNLSAIHLTSSISLWSSHVKTKTIRSSDPYIESITKNEKCKCYEVRYNLKGKPGLVAIFASYVVGEEH